MIITEFICENPDDNSFVIDMDNEEFKLFQLIINRYYNPDWDVDFDKFFNKYVSAYANSDKRILKEDI